MENSVTVSLAQLAIKRGDLNANLEQHIKMIELSAHHSADVVVFPELSLTGYELDLASKLAVSPEPGNFSELSQASVRCNIIVIAGIPLKSHNSPKPTIGAVICFPNGEVQFNSKQYLHPGEDEYCSSGDKDCFFDVKGHRVALAICADFTHSDHAKRAKSRSSDIYLVSALISESGYAPDSKILSEIASQHKLPVLLSNHISKTGDWDTCGNNSVWNSQGELTVSSNSKQSGLVLCTFVEGDVERGGVVI